MKTKPNPFQKIKHHAKQLKNNIQALYLAQIHPQTPWYAKAFIVFLFLFVLSPIDLIPDFIPILGLLDDLLLIPLGLWLAIKLIPPPIYAECQQKAQTNPPTLKKQNWLGAILILLLWALLLVSIILKIKSSI